MQLHMNTHTTYTIEEIQKVLLLDTIHITVDTKNKDELYTFIEKVLTETRYILSDTKKRDKTSIVIFLRKVTGLSKVHIKRLIKIKRVTGHLQTQYKTCNKFTNTYTRKDIELLAKTDNAHNRREGNATRVHLQRQYEVYHLPEFERLSKLSVSHLYNLRKTSPVYKKEELTYTKTNPVSNSIGIRKKPNNQGIPGYLRIDSVHQGDKDGEKGVYYVNVVDEVTQWEFVFSVESISEHYMRPVLIELLEKYPFVIHNFHSDNGSEYINYVVATILEKLCIDQTKSRSRHSNDNGLVESKNSSVIRKCFGYAHIARENAPLINTFLREYFDEYINYHRVCAFPTKTIDSRGKEKTTYKEHTTPFRKLLSLPDFTQYLKKDGCKEDLFAIEKKKNDNESGEGVRKAYKQLQTKMRRKDGVFEVSF